MNRDDKNRQENRIIAMILICTCIILILNVLTVKNVLSGNELLERADVLAQKAEELKGTSEVVAETEVSEPQTEEPAEEEESSDTEMEIELGGVSDSETDASSNDWLDLESFLREPQERGEQWAVSVLNLSDGTSCGVNETVSMQSASVIKVFIMAAVYDRVCYPADAESGIYVPEQYDGELKDLLVNMITVSDNAAANRLVELLGNGDFEAGKEIVNDYCMQNGYTGTSLGRRFLAENPQGDNYTTAADCRKILQDLYNGTCVCEEASGKMLAMLQGQTVTTKIPSGLPAGVSSANKTGEMPEGYGLGCIENDIAIVYGENCDYILCVLSNDLGGRNEEAKARIIDISEYVYNSLQ